MEVNVERKQQVDFEKLGRPSFSNFLNEPWIIPQLTSKLQHSQDINTCVMIEGVLRDKETAAEGRGHGELQRNQFLKSISAVLVKSS